MDFRRMDNGAQAEPETVYRNGMTELRRRYRQVRRAQSLASYGRYGTFRRAVKFPLRALREAAGAVRLCGAATTARYGVSPLRQLVSQYLMRLRYDIMPDDYYLFRLFLPERHSQAWAYVTPFAHRALVLNSLRQRPTDATETLDDKLQFGAWCAKHQLPTTPIVATVEPGTVPDIVPQFPATDLFSKPRVGGRGAGVCVWRYARTANGIDNWHDDMESYAHGGVDAAGLLSALAADPKQRPHLVQHRAVNHPLLRDLSLGGLCTVRAVTIRDREATGNREAFALLLAYYRMPVGANAADNVHAGGIAASIDIATGRLGPALCKQNDAGVIPLDVHPSTGAPITDSVLPCWPELESLVLRAHSHLPTLGIIGWDVAMTPDGPLLIEGNVSPGALSSQMPSGNPLGRTAYVARMLELELPDPTTVAESRPRLESGRLMRPNSDFMDGHDLPPSDKHRADGNR